MRVVGESPLSPPKMQYLRCPRCEGSLKMREGQDRWSCESCSFEMKIANPPGEAVPTPPPRYFDSLVGQNSLLGDPETGIRSCLFGFRCPRCRVTIFYCLDVMIHLAQEASRIPMLCSLCGGALPAAGRLAGVPWIEVEGEPLKAWPVVHDLSIGGSEDDDLNLSRLDQSGLAHICPVDGHFLLDPGASRVPIRTGGVTLDSPARLHHGDRFQIGDHVLVFNHPEPGQPRELLLEPAPVTSA